MRTTNNAIIVDQQQTNNQLPQILSCYARCILANEFRKNPSRCKLYVGIEANAYGHADAIVDGLLSVII